MNEYAQFTHHRTNNDEHCMKVYVMKHIYVFYISFIYDALVVQKYFYVSKDIVDLYFYIKVILF